jgi:ABC-type transport system involved in multi-copper enzyme maturation permease subunit
MRPYLAVLKDSFREALASRVLWIVILLITVVLLLVAPLGVTEEKSSRLEKGSVRNWPALVEKIDQELRVEGPSPGSQIAARLTTPLKAALDESLKISPPEIPVEVLETLIDELNGILADPTFYEPAAWRDAELADEARELLARGVGRLNEDEVVRFNRLLLKAAYADEFAREEPTQTSLSYFTLKVLGPYQISRAQATPIISQLIAEIVNVAVGVFTVFAAILVTASMIPQTFEAGSIDLLLSKPVSRTLLFLTKFLGGCAFIALNAAYFIFGLWLIAGARFGIWSNKLFLCIPVILFLFAVYYSVSALAGIVWRNAIVSVVMTIIFWGICFGVWATKSFIDASYIAPERLVNLIPAGDGLLAVDEKNAVLTWRTKDATWSEVFANENQTPGPMGIKIRLPLTGTVYDARHERLLALQMPLGGGGFSLFGPAPTLFAGRSTEGWSRKKGPAPPAGTFTLGVTRTGGVVAVTRGAVYRLQEGEARGAKNEKALSDSKGGPTNEKFVRSGPQPALRFEPSATAAIDSESGALAAFSEGAVSVLELADSGKYARKVEKKIDAARDAKTAVIAIGGKTVLLGLPDGRVLILDAADLTLKQELRPEGAVAPRFAGAAPGGRWFSVLFHNRRLWLFDADNGQAAGAAFNGQGDISAAVFDGPHRLAVADRCTRVTRYQLDPFRAEDVLAPAMSNMQMAYYYVIVPGYTLTPRQGELGDAVRYLLDDKDKGEENPQDPRTSDLSRPRKTVNMAGPIASSLVFLAVMLALSCLYVWRSDF